MLTLGLQQMPCSCRLSLLSSFHKEMGKGKKGSLELWSSFSLPAQDHTSLLPQNCWTAFGEKQ